MSLWPYFPVGEVTEVLEWRTDVLRARAGEQRFRLRERPRRQWHFEQIFDAAGQASARALVRGATGFDVPDWTRQVYAGPVSAGASVSIAMSTEGYGLEAGKRVLLWSGRGSYEACVIESVSPAALVLENVVTARASTGLYRVDAAGPDVELSFSRPAGRLQYANISFYSVAAPQHAASTYAQYRGHDVLPVVPVVGAGALAESLAWPYEVFDNETGMRATEKARDLADEKFTMRWHALRPDAIQATRAWIASRYGRWLAFWLPSWQRDLTAAADIASGATTLRVFAPAGAISLGHSAFDIEISGPAAVYRRRVSAVSAGPEVSGQPTLDLTLDSALGVALTAAQFGAISYLRCVRFDADRIELLHRPGEGLAVSVPCIEVPVP